MRFQFTGTDAETFPTILTEEGTLVLKPGAVVDLATDPGHPRLVPVKGKVLEDDVAGWPAAVDDEPSVDPEVAPAADPTNQEG